MPFKKGHKLATGRPKGSRNKLKLARETLEKNGFDPILKLVNLYDIAIADGDLGVAAKCASELAKYVYVMPKVITHEGDVTVTNTHELVKTERKFVNLLLEDPRTMEAIKVIEATAIQVKRDI